MASLGIHENNGLSVSYEVHTEVGGGLLCLERARMTSCSRGALRQTLHDVPAHYFYTLLILRL